MLARWTNVAMIVARPIQLVILASAVIAATPAAEAQLNSAQPRTPTETAAFQHFRQGIQAMDQQQYDKAIQEFKRAAQLQPRDDDFRAALSAALLSSGRPALAWNQARTAVRLGPQNPRAAEQLMATWGHFARQGAFATGQAPADVKAVLGDADRINRAGTNARWIYGFMAMDFAKEQLYSTIDLRGLKPELERPMARVSFQVDGRAWSVKQRVVTSNQTSTEYTLPRSKTEAAPAEPPETILVQRLFETCRQGTSVIEWVEKFKLGVLRESPQARFEILIRDPKTIVFEVTSSSAESKSARYEITRVFCGRRDLHRLSYRVVGPPPTADTRQTWSRLINEAHLLDLTKPSTEVVPSAPATD